MSTESPWRTSLRHFARFGGRVAVSSRGQTLTYAELAAQAEAVRATLIAAGAQCGEPVAILARHGPGAVAALTRCASWVCAARLRSVAKRIASWRANST